MDRSMSLNGPKRPWGAGCASVEVAMVPGPGLARDEARDAQLTCTDGSGGFHGDYVENEEVRGEWGNKIK